MPDPALRKLLAPNGNTALIQALGVDDRSSPAVLASDIYVKVLAPPSATITDPPNKRVQVVRVVDDGNDVWSYPPICGKILDLNTNLFEDVPPNDASWLDARDMFQSLRKYDKVVIDNAILATYIDLGALDLTDYMTIASVEDTGYRAKEGVVEITLRSIVKNPNPATGAGFATIALKDLKRKKELNSNGLNVPVRIYVRQADVVRLATAEDVLASTQYPTVYDQIAVRYPAYFVFELGQYSWKTIKDLYRASGANKKTRVGPELPAQEKTLTHNFGGMNALQEYRLAVSERLLEHIKDLADLNTRIARELEAAQLAVGGDPAPIPEDRTLVDPALTEIRQFVAGAQPMYWNAAGSTDATSDVDIGTFRDGTEWAAKVFNFLFRELHGGFESGDVFDVNVYAGGYLPEDWDAFKVRTAGQGPQYLDPALIYKLSDQGDIDDVAYQTGASLLHLNRYLQVRPGEQPGQPGWWTTFKQGTAALLAPNAVASSEFATACSQVETAYAQNRYQLANAMWRQVTQGVGRADKDNPSYQVFSRPLAVGSPVSACDAIIDNASLKPADRDAVKMACENRLYEARLAALAPLKIEWAYRVSQGEPTPAIDATCRNIRKGLADSSYFGNECYATEGSLIQVVGGKQIVSAGVGVDKKGGFTGHNIKYTFDQLFHSLNEQMGDFFKESTRHAEHEAHAAEPAPPATIAADSVLNSAKYLHRYFNALKYLYLLPGGLYDQVAEFNFWLGDDDGPEEFDVDLMMDIARSTGSAVPSLLKDLPGLNALPVTPGRAAFTTPQQGFDQFRRGFGYGLEMLKRFDFAQSALPDPRKPLPAAPAAGDRQSTYLDALQYKLGGAPAALMTAAKPNKIEITKWVIATYLPYLQLTAAEVAQATATLTGFQAVMLKLHSTVVKDYYTLRPTVP